MKDITVFGITISAWILVPALYFIWVSFFLFIKKVAVITIRRFVSKTRTKIDDVFLDAANLPANLLIFVSGTVVFHQFIPVTNGGEILHGIMLGFKAVTIVAIIMFLDRLFQNLIRNYSGRVQILRSSESLAQGILRILVMGIGVLILLDSFGVSITPILASLGIGSLAVALALQPTLENFFSGIQLIIDKPIRVGDFVQIDSGQEGYVHKIGWRSTWLRMPANNVVVIPNKELVNARILNYYYPSPDLAVTIPVAVHYKSNLAQVERVTIEVAQEIMKTIDGGVPDFEPAVRFHTFGDSSINFTVVLHAKEISDGGLIKHEFIKALKIRYDNEGICIPYPTRTIYQEQEIQAAQKISENKSI